MALRLVFASLIAFHAVFGCTWLDAGETSQFRGPSGNGVYSDSLPVDWDAENWDAENNVRWSVEIPGGGWSSPVTAGDRIFVTTAVAESDSRPKGFGAGVQSMGEFYRSQAPDQPYSFEMHCLDAGDGKALWRLPVVVRKPPNKIHPSNSYATESPVTDGRRVFAYFAAVGTVACVDLEGNQIWTRELGAYKTSNDFGTGSSLAIHNGTLFVQCDNEEKSFVCGLDVATGEDVWRDDRDSRTSWSSPVIWKNRLRTELVVCGSENVTSYDPNGGEIFWRLTGTSSAFSASPTFDQDRIYRERLPNASSVTASLWAAGDKLFAIDESGETSVLKAGEKFELLDSNPMEGLFWSTPTATDSMLPVRAADRLYCIAR